MLGWWELNSPVTNYSFNCLSDRGDTSQYAEKEWLEHSSFRFGVWGFTIKLLPNYLVAGSGFAPLVSPLWVGQGYYFSNLLKTSNHWLLLLIALRELSEMMASSIASYLTELLAKVLAGKVGLEPTLFWLTVSSLYHISSIPICCSY